MGSSNWQTIPFCVDVLRRVRPRRVLDVGVGFGRWGILVREFCELWEERVHPSTWQLQVEGIEAFPDNIAAWHRSFYNTIHQGDARQLLRQLEGPWDLVIFGDVLEHFEKGEARELLELTLGKAQYVLINIPLGDQYGQGERYGNPYEAHLSEWAVGDFVRPEARASRLYYDTYNRPYLSTVLGREDPRALADLGTGPADVDVERELAAGWSAALSQVQTAMGRLSAAQARAEELDRLRVAAESRATEAERRVGDAGARAADAEARRAEAADRAAAAQRRADDAQRRVDQAGRELQQARHQTKEVRAHLAELEANINAVEASVAWRMLRVADRLYLLALPRLVLRGLRRLRGQRPAPPPAATSAPASPAAPSGDSQAQVVVATPSGAGNGRTPFSHPIASRSEDFARLLLRLPESFENVFHAPALMTPQERVALYGLAFSLAPQRYLEIGTCRGGSATIISAAMDDVGHGRGIGVDPAPAMTAEVEARVGGRFQFVRGPSPAALPRAAELAGGPFDMVLVDGDHSVQATREDLEGVLPLTAAGAAILVHDAYNPQVREAIDAFVAAHAPHVHDCGMVAHSPMKVADEDGGQEWGGLYLLRVAAAAQD